MVGGTLDEIGLSHLIQVYCTSRQTAKLTVVYPDAEGSFFFDRGELVDALLGSLAGIDAVHSALGKKGGRFHVDLGVVPPRRTIAQHWSTIVIEAIRSAEQGAGRAGGTPPTAPAAGPHKASGSTAPIPAPRAAPTAASREVVAIKPVEGRAAPAAAVRAESTPRPRPVAGERPPVRPATAATVAAVAAATPAAPSRLPIFIAVGASVVLVAAGLFWYLGRSRASSPAVAPAAHAVRHLVITLGMSAALSGPAKELGQQMKLGVETCLSAVNDAGGIDGDKFQLVAVDDGYEPDRTRQAMKELVEQKKVFAIVGNVGTPTAEVAVPYALGKKILFFGAFTGAGLLRKDPPDRYVFNYRASYAEETAAVVKYLVELRKIKPTQIAVFAQQDGFGDAGFAGVTRALRRYGRNQDQILRVGFKRNTLVLNDAVAEILKNRNQIRAIVMVAPYRPAALFIEKLKDQGFDPIFTNVSFVGSTALAEELRQLGPTYSAGVIVTQVVPPVDSQATAVIQYRNALQKYFPGENPDFVSLEGYIATSVLMEGFRRAGKNPTTESLIDALESIHGLDLGIGTPITYGLSEHQASHKVWGTVLDDKANYQVFDLE